MIPGVALRLLRGHRLPLVGRPRHPDRRLPRLRAAAASSGGRTPSRSRSAGSCSCCSTGRRCSSTCRPSTGCCAPSCPSWCFGIIVVFQAEIRKGLAHLGRAPFLGGAARRRQEEVVDEIVLAATSLASERTGAIVVLEREMGLRSYIETGIALDAVVTYDLLVSIFHPATPLHDGAVVIQGNRVAAAACFLPLTVNPELSRTLGSRHRAAIGLTEDTDAVAIVVSEETGTISIVEGGQHPARARRPRAASRRCSPRSASCEAAPAAAAPAGADRGRAVNVRRGDTPLRIASLVLAVGAVVRHRGPADRGARGDRARGAAQRAAGPRAHRRRREHGRRPGARLARPDQQPGAGRDPGHHRPRRGGRGRADRAAHAGPDPGPLRLPGGQDHALAPHPEPRAHAAEDDPGAPAADRPAGAGLRGRRGRPATPPRSAWPARGAGSRRSRAPSPSRSRSKGATAHASTEIGERRASRTRSCASRAAAACG